MKYIAKVGDVISLIKPIPVDSSEVYGELIPRYTRGRVIQVSSKGIRPVVVVLWNREEPNLKYDSRIVHVYHSELAYLHRFTAGDKVEFIGGVIDYAIRESVRMGEEGRIISTVRYDTKDIEIRLPNRKKTIMLDHGTCKQVLKVIPNNSKLEPQPQSFTEKKELDLQWHISQSSLKDWMNTKADNGTTVSRSILVSFSAAAFSKEVSKKKRPMLACIKLIRKMQ